MRSSPAKWWAATTGENEVMFRHRLDLGGAASPSRAMQGGHFDRRRLPAPIDYYRRELPELRIRGDWASACCPFHPDRHPSFAIHLGSGSYLCRACGARGRDVLAFHMARYGQDFRTAAEALGAWDREP